MSSPLQARLAIATIIVFAACSSYRHVDPSVLSVLRGSAMNKYVGPVYWEIGDTTNNYPAQAADWACWRNGLQGPGGARFSVSTTECGDAYLDEITTVGRGIVLMHDSSEAVDGSVSTLAMVKYMVPILKARGYAFVRLDEVPDIAALLPPLPCGSIKGCPGRRRLGRREHLDVASPRRLTTVDRLSSSGSGWRIAWARHADASWAAALRAPGRRASPRIAGAV